MVNNGSGHHYSFKRKHEGEVVRAKASNLAVKFKNLVEISAAVRGMTIKRANAYLKNVIAHKECVPFRNFKGGIGQCAQAKAHKTVLGRWPVNAAKCVLDLLRNAVANCEFYGKDTENFIIKHIQANQAVVSRRRTYRAHGRINPYERHRSHMQVVLQDKSDA